MTVEICCGAAGLSSALRRLGFKTYAVDHSQNRHAPKVKPLIIDVSNSQQLKILISILLFCKPCYVHFGLPCGTCSRARERPLPSYLQHIKAPQPLRDEQHLEGLPSLTGSDLMKVQAANALYQAAVTLLEICMQLKCCITIENPLRSWLWMLLAHYIKQSGDQALIDWYSNLECVTFDACAHGSDRDKRTKLLATPGVFSDLEQYCPKNHQHASCAPYKVHNRLVFPTATEAEYPSLLCSRMSACVQQFAASHGISLMLEPKLKDLMKLQLGQQSIRHPPLIAEFKTFVFMDKPSTDPSMKLLAAPINQGPQQPEQQEKPEQGPSSLKRKHDEAPSSSSKRNTFKHGVWHSPLEFLDKALQAKHPLDDDGFLHGATKAAIEKVLVTDPVTLAKQRLAVVFNLRKLQSEMSSKELESRRGMHHDVDKCTTSKSIALFAHVLKQLEYWDLGARACHWSVFRRPQRAMSKIWCPLPSLKMSSWLQHFGGVVL